MKKTFFLLLTLCTTAITYVSCGSDGDDVVNQADTSAVGASVVIDAVNEIDVNTGLQVTAENTAAKSAENPAGPCATITVDTPTDEAYPKIFTVDFGTGCTVNQITRKGKLKITLTGSVFNTGSKMTIERIDYAINSMKLEGTIEYVNTTTEQTVPKWTRKVINGKLTDLLGRVYTNSGNYTTKQTEGVATLTLADNVYEIIEGTHTVTSDNGGVLTLTVQENLVKKYSCEFISKGKLKVQGGYLNGVVDYGNNDCDRKYSYTHENGDVYDLTM
ncbi:MAG: hypothetical protein EOO44_02855 [Flavobacterium sp.]|nr:MAG: hypothetical protein EOO44_02855 [Flavobacterium sp.]